MIKGAPARSARVVKAADHVPSGAVHSEALDRLFDDGPFLSVYMNTEPAIENASRRDQLGWKGLRDSAARRRCRRTHPGVRPALEVIPRVTIGLTTSTPWHQFQGRFPHWRERSRRVTEHRRAAGDGLLRRPLLRETSRRW